MAAYLDGDQKAMVAAKNEAREWNRRAVLEKRQELKIDLNHAVKARRKVRQPMKQITGLSRDYREAYGM
jgi:hypothetical protein